jgi:hypothetical protein
MVGRLFIKQHHLRATQKGFSISAVLLALEMGLNRPLERKDGLVYT